MIFVRLALSIDVGGNVDEYLTIDNSYPNNLYNAIYLQNYVRFDLENRYIDAFILGI